MKKIYWLRKFIVFYLFLSLSYALAEHYYYPGMTLFPLFDWELGFGSVYSTDTMAEVMITSVNGEPLIPIKTLKEWALERNDWMLTNDYKLPILLQKSIHWKNKSIFTGRQKTFHERFFSDQDIKSVSYELFEVKYDPLERYLHGKILGRKKLGNFVYKKETESLYEKTF